MDNPQTRDIIQANLPQLKHALAEQGIKLNEVNVMLAGNGFSGETPHRREQFKRWNEQNGKIAKANARLEAIGEIERSQILDPGLVINRHWAGKYPTRKSFDSIA